MKRKLLDRIISIILSFNLVFNNLAPFVSFSIVKAQDVTPEPTTEVTVSPEVSPTETVSPTVEPTQDVTPTETVDVTPTVKVTPVEETSPTVEPSLDPQEASSVPSPPQYSNTSSGGSSSSPTPEMSVASPLSPSPTPEVLQSSTLIGTVETQVVESYSCRVDSLNGCLITDKADYAPTDVVIITGYGFAPNTSYTLRVYSTDEPATDNSYQITTDSNGSFTYSYQLDGTYRPNYTVELKDDGGFIVASVTFTDGCNGNNRDLGCNCENNNQCNSNICSANICVAAPTSTPTPTNTSGGGGGGNPSADLDQYANDPPQEWVNGNLGASKATYYEGDTVPYRIKFSNLSLTLHTITFEWDTTKSGKHATDYLKTYNATVVGVDPCESVSGCSGPVSTFAIPADPQVTGAGVSQTPGNFTLFGGTITGVSAYSYPNGAGFTGDKSARITVTFTASQANPVLAWGGHISDRGDWGEGNSAISIPGSPYHMRLIDLDGSGGNQDRSLSADAVIFPASITIIKAASPEGSTSFPFTSFPSPLSNFDLVDDGTSTNTHVFSDIVDFQTYQVSETTPSGWILDGIVCGVTSANGGSQNVVLPGVSINLKEGENVTCTFTNTQQSGHLIVQKSTVPSGDATEFTINTSGTGTITSGGLGTITDAIDKVYEVTAGTYSVTETVPSGWTKTGDTCQNVVVGAGETKYCLLTNTKKGHIIVDKITNPSGDSQSFNFTATGAGYSNFSLTDVATPNDQELNPGSYSISETVPSGWDLTSSTCVSSIEDSETAASLELDAGETITCTFTNTKRGSISGYKYEDADGSNSTTNDRSAVQGLIVQLWKWVTDAFTYTGLTDTTDSNGFYEFLDLIPGVYQVREIISSLFGTWTNVTSTEIDVTVDPGESDENNNFINTQYGTIIVEKQTIPDGDQTSFDFDLSYGDNDADLSDGQQDNSGNLLPGSYSVSENTPNGWDLTSTVCTSSIRDTETASNLELDSGEIITCVFTNSRKPTLTLVKTVVNDNGGTAVESDFQGKINGDNVPWSTAQTLDPGNYTVSETTLSGYTASDWGTDCNEDGTITLAYGDNKTCSITNDDNAPSLTLVKEVINLDGGTALPSAWDLTASGPTGFSGAGPSVSNGASFDAGTYDLSESIGPVGYTASDWVCVGGIQTDANTVNIGLGENVTCTITNDDIAPRLKLVKVVEGSDEYEAGDWDLEADGDGGFTDKGDSNTFHNVKANVNYLLKESGPDGYTAGAWDCSQVGQQGDVIMLGLDEEVTCTITNTRDTGKIIVHKIIDPDGDTDNTPNDQYPAEGWEFDVNGTSDDTSNPSAQLTDSSGKTTFEFLKTGEYDIVETLQPGYELVSISCNTELSRNDLTASVNVGKNGTVECTFVNSPNSTLRGYKWSDSDQSGGPEADFNEDKLKDWVIHLYKEVDEDVYTLVDSKTTADNPHYGWYWFEHLFPGNYKICEELQSGWKQTYPLNENDNCHLVTLPLETSGQIYNFGNVGLGRVNVVKYNDLNGNGKRDEGEPTLPDWEILLSENGSQNTNQDGQASFEDVLPGTYVLGETMQEGWQQTNISCEKPQEPTPTPTTGEETPTPSVTISPTPIPSSNICHWNEGADKWNALAVPLTNKGHDSHEKDFEYKGPVDSKGHPAKDPQNKDNPETNGDAWCEENAPQTAGFRFGISQVNAQETEPVQEGYEVDVEPGKVVNCEIGNQSINPELQISKSNDAVGDKGIGDLITYTLKIKALKSKVLGVKVKDLLPKGFEFQNVVSCVLKHDGSETNIPCEPNYHSPGTYPSPSSSVDLDIDDEFIIKYTAKIGSSVDPGLYKDLAWAVGDDVLENRVLALAQEEGYVSTNFVGTKVSVNANLTQGGNIEIGGEVLGASTSLPATGGNQIWIIIASILTGLGLLIMLLGTLMKKLKILVSILLTLIVFGFVSAGSASAANLIIRLEQPKSPTSKNDFNITFTVMDLSESPGAITVKCFKKGPSDGGYSQFGSDIAVSAGGNTGDCTSVSNFMNTNGTYQFYATASNGSETATSESEGIISVGYNTQGDPTPPSNYKKEKISSCQYRITFRTADDGLTTRVEVYRSDSTSFNLDGSTRVGDISIGPNQDGSFEESVPDCNKTYYYVIRSFNSSGNPSGPVGDSAVTVTTSTVTTEGGAIPVANANVPQGRAGSGQILGEKDEEASPTAKPEVVEAKDKSVTGAVKGVADFVKNKTKLSLLIGLSVLGLGYGIYYFFKKRGQSNSV